MTPLDRAYVAERIASSEQNIASAVSITFLPWAIFLGDQIGGLVGFVVGVAVYAAAYFGIYRPSHLIYKKAWQRREDAQTESDHALFKDRTPE